MAVFIFWGIILDVAYYFISRNFDLFPKMQFDYIVEIRYEKDIQFFRRKVLLTFSISFFAIPLVLIFLNNALFHWSVRKLSNLKLLFLWSYIFSLNNFLGYLAFASFGDRSKVLTGLLRRKFKIILEYLGLSESWLPLLTALIFLFYSIRGSHMCGRFLVMSPSFSLNKDPVGRLTYLLNTVIIPLFLFTIFGPFLYINELPYESRYQNMLIFWGPALVMLYRAYRPGIFARFPACPGSWIDYPDILLYSGAVILIFLITYLIPEFYY
ncbi:MAG: hypothetical protein NZM65_01735 [Flavobacteriales bacterium]|nr:hypothetical protein [Flavobacteriales bacterium]MDW8409389.1 hypothetical protein [Flavobacteriales bacterium]